MLPKESREYEFTEIFVESEWVNAVKILDGPYKNVIYYYGYVKAVPQDDGTARLAFQYTIYDAPGLEKKSLIASEEFRVFIGDILVAIITDEQKKGEYATPRKHYSEESDL